MQKLKLLKMALLATLLSVSVYSMALADAQSIYQFVDLYQVDTVEGYKGDNPDDTNEYTAGVFDMELLGTDQNVGAYCTDLESPAFLEHYFRPSDESMSCEVLWIINHPTYGPKLSGLDTLQSRTGQSAVWHYSNDFTITSPGDVKNATNSLIEEAEQKAGDWCRSLVEFQVLFAHLGGDDYVITTDPATPNRSFDIYDDIYDDITKVNTVTTDGDGEANFTQSGSSLKAVLKWEQQEGAVLEHAGADNEKPNPDKYQKLVMPGEVGYVDVVFHPQEPTAIELKSFTVTEASPGRAKITWATSSETDNAGFNIYRAPSDDGLRVQVNESMIRSKNPNGVNIHYNYFDSPGQGTFYYMLEDVDLNGRSTLHDPASVKLNPAKRPPANRPVPPK